MIFSLLIIHTHDRLSSESITRVLHLATWDYFTSHLPNHFSHSPIVVKEAIMTNINYLMQEFWMISSDGGVGESFFEMRRLLNILQVCFDNLKVCFDIISIFATAVDLADEIYRCRIAGIIMPSWTLTTESESNLRQFLMGIERCLIRHYLNPKS
jgi:hypothetical protein